MRVDATPVQSAVGGILLHTLRLGQGSRLPKGLVLAADHVELLAARGVETVMVARLGPDDVPEGAAAVAVAETLAGTSLAPSASRAGRCVLRARSSGIVQVDEPRLRALLGVSEAIAVSTVAQGRPVRPEDPVAVVKIVPFAVARATVVACRRIGADGPILNVRAFHHDPIALVRTTEGPDDLTGSRVEEALVGRLDGLGRDLATHVSCAHDASALADSLESTVRDGHRLVVVAGVAATADRNDVLPAAIRQAGGRVVRFGVPVDPGQTVLLGRLGHATVLGMPGCARSPRRNGFDPVLEWALTGQDPDAFDPSDLAVGGLLR